MDQTAASNRLEARKVQLQKRIDAAADELALLNKFKPLGDYKEGTVLRWTRDRSDDTGSGRDSLYVAIKSENGYWWVAGPGAPRGPVKDEALLDFITHGGRMKQLKRAKDWKEMA